MLQLEEAVAAVLELEIEMATLMLDIEKAALKIHLGFDEKTVENARALQLGFGQAPEPRARLSMSSQSERSFL